MPTLDGWRAIAILSVVLYHDRQYSFGPVGTGWIHEFGLYGVDLFFAISGLLICSRLLEEEQVFSHISLRNFYIRRAFRILPPALLFLIVVAVLALVGVFQLHLREWLVTLLFFRNYTALAGAVTPDSNFVEHFWSLAVEEHFYLILPGILVLTHNRWRLPALLGLASLVELHCYFALKSRVWALVGHHTGVRLDYLLIPAIFAVIAQSGAMKLQFKKWFRMWPLILVGIGVLVTFGTEDFWQVTLLSLLLPPMLLGSVLNAQRYLERVLEWAPLRYLGRISYSVYLWQQLFFTGRVLGDRHPLGILEQTPLRFVATLVCAMASYHFIERPLIRLGHKLAPPATPGRSDLADHQKTAEIIGIEDGNGQIEA